MKLRAYQDEDIKVEVGDQLGRYSGSLSEDSLGVEVHFFSSGAELNVYVTKAAGVTAATAQDVTSQAIAEFTKQPEPKKPLRRRIRPNAVGRTW